MSQKGKSMSSWMCSVCDEIFGTKNTCRAHFSKEHPEVATPAELASIDDVSENTVTLGKHGESNVESTVHLEKESPGKKKTKTTKKRRKTQSSGSRGSRKRKGRQTVDQFVESQRTPSASVTAKRKTRKSVTARITAVQSDSAAKSDDGLDTEIPEVTLLDMGGDTIDDSESSQNSGSEELALGDEVSQPIVSTTESVGSPRKKQKPGKRPKSRSSRKKHKELALREEEYESSDDWSTAESSESSVETPRKKRKTGKRKRPVSSDRSDPDRKRKKRTEHTRIDRDTVLDDDAWNELAEEADAEGVSIVDLIKSQRKNKKVTMARNMCWQDVLDDIELMHYDDTTLSGIARAMYPRLDQTYLDQSKVLNTIMKDDRVLYASRYRNIDRRLNATWHHLKMLTDYVFVSDATIMSAYEDAEDKKITVEMLKKLFIGLTEMNRRMKIEVFAMHQFLRAPDADEMGRLFAEDRVASTTISRGFSSVADHLGQAISATARRKISRKVSAQRQAGLQRRGNGRGFPRHRGRGSGRTFGRHRGPSRWPKHSDRRRHQSDAYQRDSFVAGSVKSEQDSHFRRDSSQRGTQSVRK
jgi:hypothetical protein